MKLPVSKPAWPMACELGVMLQQTRGWRCGWGQFAKGLAGWPHRKAAAGHAAPAGMLCSTCCARCGHPAIQQSIWLTGRLITWLCTCSKGTAQASRHCWGASQAPARVHASKVQFYEQAPAGS